MTAQSPSAQTAPVSWSFAGFITAIHIGAIVALFHFSWQALAVALFLHWVTGCLGITLCFHRLLTHRGFSLPKPLEYFLALLGTLSLQGGPIMWVAHHRVHHAHSDHEGDPHDSSRGFWWSHMGWLFFMPEERINFDHYSRYAKDLARDPVYRFLDRNMLALQLVLALGLYLLGGWDFVLWGIFVRLVLVFHCTWLINSACHQWGYRSHQTDDRSTNLWWAALLAYGEGWHNNHHAMPRSARHGLAWWEVDVTWYIIWTLSKLGLARNVQLPT
ncbi:acyl-CoA desaturase [Gloeobacter kilaueensis]|uniref:Stearoyl-CoA 9-desaturase n=1 Tax=Gloeobacter kilaueensis (strain ATCC BAA-2537 / CCAP 1431/1 / ULC 316 / JS1) TaxID=1183438 RepID=U5QLJ7_GLOK1|nr:fatty acid desaturase [Gloeobacter kilaueensis]AGY59768.1 stearoyl-CoA 9-desaturase [Gloeobacter kilaueensis JS1]